jgi:hypothetical protein
MNETNERTDRSRHQIDNLVTEMLQERLDNTEVHMLNFVLEVLLDIRETLYRMERDQSPKWGSKL